MGLPVWLYCDALSVGRRWPGLQNPVMFTIGLVNKNEGWYKIHEGQDGDGM